MVGKIHPMGWEECVSHMLRQVVAKMPSRPHFFIFSHGRAVRRCKSGGGLEGRAAILGAAAADTRRASYKLNNLIPHLDRPRGFHLMAFLVLILTFNTLILQRSVFGGAVREGRPVRRGMSLEQISPLSALLARNK